MKRLVLTVVLGALCSGLAVAGVLRVAPRTAPDALGPIDAELAGVARELRATVTRGPETRALQWKTKEGAAMRAEVRVETTRGVRRLHLSMDASQEMNQSFNLQYLDLQQQLQDEARRLALVSNIMKTKHDTAKSAIGNVR